MLNREVPPNPSAAVPPGASKDTHASTISDSAISGSLSHIDPRLLTSEASHQMTQSGDKRKLDDISNGDNADPDPERQDLSKRPRPAADPAPSIRQKRKIRNHLLQIYNTEWVQHKKTPRSKERNEKLDKFPTATKGEAFLGGIGKKWIFPSTITLEDIYNNKRSETVRLHFIHAIDNELIQIVKDERVHCG